MTNAFPKSFGLLLSYPSKVIPILRITSFILDSHSHPSQCQLICNKLVIPINVVMEQFRIIVFQIQAIYASRNLFNVDLTLFQNFRFFVWTLQEDFDIKRSTLQLLDNFCRLINWSVCLLRAIVSGFLIFYQILFLWIC